MDKTKNELIQICKERGISNYSNKKKEEIVKLIEKFEAPKNKLKMIDLFSGTGAFSYSFINTGNVEVVFSNDMIESSKKIYDMNFQHKLTLSDLHQVDETDIPRHDILTAGFPCFIEGTPILTYNGYKNIEDVEITDKLLTHTGMFNNILNLQRKIYNGELYKIKIKYHPESIVATEEHPFYIREKKGRNQFGNPQWKKANELTKNDYFGMVINSNSIIPEFTFEKEINQYKNEKIIIKFDKFDYWFIIGYFIGNGWIEEGNGEYEIRFVINNKNEKEIFEKINNIIPITDKKCDSEKCKKFGCSNFIWYNIFKQFGIYAHGKLIPEWVQDAPNDFIQEFINGYMKADGCVNDNNVLQITTVSLNLAYGLQRLYLKLGHIFSINKCIRPKTCVIEGRTVNQKDTYCIRGILQLKRRITSFIENNYVWFAPFKIIKENTINIPVYNFEVENDNSYVVMNTIVHNCQPFSIAGHQNGFEDSRSNVFWKLLSIIDYHNPKCVILENVKNLVSHDDKKTFEIIKTNLEQRGYYIKYKILNTAEITGIPHHRERIYIVCMKSKTVYDNFSLDFPIIEKRGIQEFLETDINPKYYYNSTSKIWDLLHKDVIKQNTVYQYRRVYVRENKSMECPTLTANMGSGGHNVPIIKDSHGIRKITPRECFNLQGFPKTFQLPQLSDSSLYQLVGNSVSVPIIHLIANRIVPLLLKED